MRNTWLSTTCHGALLPEYRVWPRNVRPFELDRSGALARLQAKLEKLEPEDFDVPVMLWCERELALDSMRQFMLWAINEVVKNVVTRLALRGQPWCAGPLEPKPGRSHPMSPVDRH